jgi:hypothetical protein
MGKIHQILLFGQKPVVSNCTERELFDAIFAIQPTKILALSNK